MTSLYPQLCYVILWILYSHICLPIGNSLQVDLCMSLNSQHLQRMQQKMKSKMQQSVHREHIAKKIVISSPSQALEQQNDAQWQKVKSRYVDPTSLLDTDLVVSVFVRRKPDGPRYFFKQLCLENLISAVMLLENGGAEGDEAKDNITSAVERTLFTPHANTSSSTGPIGMGVVAPIYEEVQIAIPNLKKAKTHQLEFLFRIDENPKAAHSKVDSEVMQLFFPIQDQRTLASRVRIKKAIDLFCNSAKVLSTMDLKRLTSTEWPQSDKVRYSELELFVKNLIHSTEDLQSQHVVVVTTDGSAYRDSNDHICAGAGVCIGIFPVEKMSWDSVYDQEEGATIFGQQPATAKSTNEFVESMWSSSLLSSVKAEFLTSALHAEILAFMFGVSYANEILQLVGKYQLQCQSVVFITDSKALTQILRKPSTEASNEDRNVDLSQSAVNALNILKLQNQKLDVQVRWHFGHPELKDSNPEKWQLLDKMLWNADFVASPIQDLKQKTFGKTLPKWSWF